MLEHTAYNFEVRVLMLLENGTWIAQGLDYDITGHGESTDEALENFGKTLLGQAILDLRHGQEPLACVPKAPDFYWKRFEEAGWRGQQKRFAVPEETPPAFVISALAADTRIYA
jgi:hypothetical protein